MPISLRSLLPADQKATIKSLLQSGDILLESNNVYPLSQIITKIIDGGNWIHSAIYVGDNKVIDAGRKPFVASIKLDKFLLTTDVAIYRPKYHSADDISAVLSFVNSSIGAPFNLNFDDTDQHTFYCTQLISRALLSMPHPIRLKHKTIFWITAIPNSSVEQRESDFTCIWSSHPRFWLNIGVHWPVFLSATLGAYCGSLLSLYALFPGVLIGAVFSILIGNRISTYSRHSVPDSQT